MRILLKFPIRERVEKFVKVLRMYESTCTNPDNVTLLVTIDDDDIYFTDWVIQSIEKVFKHTIICKGKPEGKIAAINRDMDKAGQWDICVVASDDMIPQVRGWDEELIEKMPKDLDHVLFYNDGYCGRKLNTMCIFGRKYYERFNYIYHPAYQSLWCDNEFMEVADILKKQTYYNLCLFRHEHFSTNRHIKADSLMEVNQSFYFADGQTYKRRKEKNFDLNV